MRDNRKYYCVGIWSKNGLNPKIVDIMKWRDVQRKNVANNVDKSSLIAPWQNGPYIKHLEHHEACRTTKRNRYLE